MSIQLQTKQTWITSVHTYIHNHTTMESYLLSWNKKSLVVWAHVMHILLLDMNWLS